MLWSRGPSTAREVYETLRRRRRSAHHSTVLKFLQIMAQKGLVRRDERERAQVYAPAQSRESMQRQLAGDLLQRGFDWSMKHLMIGALSARDASSEEIGERGSRAERFVFAGDPRPRLAYRTMAESSAGTCIDSTNRFAVAARSKGSSELTLTAWTRVRFCCALA